MPAIAAAVDWLRSLPVWLGFFVLSSGTFVATWVLAYLVGDPIRRFVSSTNTDLDAAVYREVRVPIAATASLLGVFLAGTWLDLGTAADVVRSTVLSIVLIAWSRAAVRLGEHILEGIGRTTPEAADFAPIFENLWTFVVLAITGLLLLSIWEVNVTPIIASAGVAGVALGFAAKDTVANFFGSIALYFDDTYTVGDYIVLEDGREGTVLDVTIRSTRILTREDVVVTVPNSVLNAAKLVNRSDPRPITRVTMEIGVAYGTDLERFEDIVLEVAHEEPLIVDAPAPRMRLRQLGASAPNYELRCWVSKPLNDEVAQHRLLKEIYQRLDDAGIDLAYPTRTIRMDAEEAVDESRVDREDEPVLS